MPAAATTPGGFLLVLSLAAPFVGVLLALAAGGRRAEKVALVSIAVGLGLALAIVIELVNGGMPLVYVLGAWEPPLGVALRADGLSAAMMLTAAIVLGAIALFARADFGTSAEVEEARAPFAFWILLVATGGALNSVFLSGDLFTLFVALELLTFAAVPLVCLDGRAETLSAALRYLLFALLGSVFYLAGTGLLYGAFGTLDIALLSARIAATPATAVAAALMTAGLLAKTALFPLHFWLPPAHAGAPPAASAVLSALVIKGSFFIVVRLWFDTLPALPSPAGVQLLAGLGAAAILYGSVLALRQERLKLLIAYSTVAQIGYLFLMFPLAFDPESARLASGSALTAGMMQAIAHAAAKAAMFMAAGLIYAEFGHDRIAALGGVARRLPLAVLAFALAGVSLIGLPPSGGFLAKWMLLSEAAAREQWWWAAVLLIGGLLSAAYVWHVLVSALGAGDQPAAARGIVSRRREGVVLALAICSLLLGLTAFLPVNLLQIGRPVFLAVEFR